MTACDLHLISWNRPKMTELVIKTIKRNTKPGNYRLVVLDNGSEGDTPDRLQDLADAGLIDEYIPIKTNLGLEAARQMLLVHATLSPRFVCIDNDCLPQPELAGLDWLERLNELMDKYEGYAAISARTQVMIGTGNIFAEADENGADIVDFPHPGGSYRLMDRDLTLRVGGWQAGSPGRGGEERYIGARLAEHGYKTAFSTHVKSLHLFGGNDTDRWGYDKYMTPAQSGHSDVHHPALVAGDDPEMIIDYAGKELCDAYRGTA